MKKIFFIILSIAIMASFLILTSVHVQAETFSPEKCLNVSGSGTTVIVTGAPDDVDKIKKLVQFCPDRYVAGCPDNRYISPTQSISGKKVFELSDDGITARQVNFNFKNREKWLHIPNALVAINGDTGMEMGTEGARFNQSYVPDRPITNTGEACVQSVMLGSSNPGTTQSVVREIPGGGGIGGSDNKVDVKGDNNDVTPQSVKQQAKQRTSVRIKGNNNGVNIRKKIDQIGVNAKSTGANSPVTVNVFKGHNAADYNATSGLMIKTEGNVTVVKDGKDIVYSKPKEVKK